jgi:YYY domain-containing protein
MDFGFISSILKTEHLPPPDMWFAGSSINYYWFGHLWTAVLTKLSDIDPFVTYNLMLATILGLSLTSTFSISSTLIKKVKVNKKLLYFAGIASAILLVFGGNFHTPFYVLKEGKESYWYPDATRFIGYNPETEDKTIHEFPMYSFTVSDLHAHLLNLPFVLLFVAFLWNFIDGSKGKPKLTKKIIPIGFLLGVFFMTNTWDFGNYLLLTGVSLFIINLISRKLRFETLFNTALLGFLIFLTSLVVLSTFLFNFESIAQGVKLVNSRTPAWQLAILWGFPAVLTFIFSLTLLKQRGKIKRSDLFLIFLTALVVVSPFLLNFESIAQGVKLVNARTPAWQLAILWGFPAVLTFIFSLTLLKQRGKIKRSDLFVISILATSWILIFLPEIIYVKDIYIASHHRANTMFKLTYQAFVMFYLSSGYIFSRSLSQIKNFSSRLPLAFFYGGLITAIMIYPYFSIKSYYGELKTYKELRGDGWLRDYNLDTFNAVLWMNENIKGQPIIVEAPGDSYTQFNVISSYTGFPTVSGWFVHEWLWRGDSSFPQERVTEISNFYTTEDINLARAFINKYGVEYIILGNFERQKFPELREQKFYELGTIVFSSPTTMVFEVK